MANKIAICTHKGGTGKTVTTLALAAGLARSGAHTLLIDLDPQGHCNPGLGVNMEEPSIAYYFEKYPEVSLQDISQKTSVDNLEILPSSLDLAWQAESLGGKPRKEEFLRRGLNKMEAMYQWVIIDTPPSLGALTQNAVSAADLIIIPTVPEARAANAVTDMVNLIKVLRGDEFNNYRLLLTRVDSRKTAANAEARELIKPWKDRVFQTEIPQSEPLNRSQMRGKDIFDYDNASTGAQAYMRLIDELATVTV